MATVVESHFSPIPPLSPPQGPATRLIQSASGPRKPSSPDGALARSKTTIKDGHVRGTGAGHYDDIIEEEEEFEEEEEVELPVLATPTPSPTVTESPVARTHDDGKVDPPPSTPALIAKQRERRKQNKVNASGKKVS